MKCMIGIAAALLAAGVPAVAAQGESDSVRLRNDCRLATQIISQGHPKPHDEWAWDVIHRCGAEGGAALGAALRAARFSTDTGYLIRLTGKARWLRDGSFFAAAMEVAGDRSATVPARLYAMVVLLYVDRLEQPRFNGVPIYYRDLLSRVDSTTGFPIGDCGLGRLVTGVPMPAAGAPLPPDYRREIVALGGRLFRDSSEVHEVRVAAFCLV